MKASVQDASSVRKTTEKGIDQVLQTSVTGGLPSCVHWEEGNFRNKLRV